MDFKTPKDVSRPPLITPSASPPPRTSSSGTNAAPPSKRQRLASASRSSSLRRSVSASDSNLDIQKEREASRARLLDTWSHLAERYSRPLDEDDIVDIRTGEIIKDNGFWRTTRQFKFGEVIAPEYQERTAAEESGDEDGIDELDAFPEEHDYLEDVFARGLQRAHSVSSNVESEDEADLEEFLEAEKRRKEEYGSDMEEQIVEPRGTAGKESSSYSPSTSFDPRKDDCEEGEKLEGDEDESDINQDLPGTGYDSGSENSGSGDELDNWEPTEASMVVVAPGQIPESLSADEQPDSESEVEIVYPPELVEKPLPHKQQTQPTQLYTPPLSSSSVDRPTTGCIEIASPSPSTRTQSGRSPDARRGRNDSVSPRKPQAHLPQPRSSTSSRRAKTPLDVIELTDDEEENKPPPSRMASPISSSPLTPLPSTVLPIERARSRTRGIVPEVVITTLPPLMNQAKVASENPRSKPNLSPRKSIKQSIISDALSGRATPNKSPKKAALAEALPRPSFMSQKVKSSRAAKEAEKITLAKGKLASYRTSSPTREEPVVDQTLNQVSRESSPEIGLPVDPNSSTKRLSVRRASSVSSFRPKSPATRKRRRSSSANDDSQRSSTSGKLKEASKPKSMETTAGRVNSARSQGSRRSRSRSRRTPPSEDHNASDSDDGLDHQRQRVARRFASVSATVHSNYSPLPTAPHHGIYPPVADPRAQQIITSAMQQLAALLWTPTHSGTAVPVYPHTPTHHKFSSVGPSFMHSTPDHPHPYPFSFDPSFSKATLPPSSPEIPSSPIKPRDRRKSLVSRSHSRGRHVSFRIDDKDGSSLDSDSGSSTFEPLRSPNKQRRGRKDKSLSPQWSGSKAKGKHKAIERSVSPFESEADGDEDVEDERSAKITRAKSGRTQTPSLEQDDVSASSSRSRSLTKYQSKQRGKHNSGPND